MATFNIHRPPNETASKDRICQDSFTFQKVKNRAYQLKGVWKIIGIFIEKVDFCCDMPDC